MVKTAGERKEDRIMKIMVIYENENVFPHFGHIEHGEDKRGCAGNGGGCQ